MDRFDRKDLTDTAFDIVLRGYDKRQVEERLRFLGAELMAAEDAHRATTQRVAGHPPFGPADADVAPVAWSWRSSACWC
jgi:hypothetical protein